MTEQDIQNSIRLKLSELGYATFRCNVGKVKTSDGRWFDTGLPKGHSDLYAVKDGRIYYIEVKKPGGHPSVEQINFINIMRDQYGCVAGIVYSTEEAVKLVTRGT